MKILEEWPNWRWPKNTDHLWTIGFLFAAILLYTIALGNLPLRDWDEGIVAQVVREMGRGEGNWLHPKMVGNIPYLNKPPLVHWFIAALTYFTGMDEFFIRFFPSLLTALSVPLFYQLNRELFPHRITAVFSTLVYLTLMPLVRHGRLAMLDGAVIFFFLLFLFCLLRSRRDLRYTLGVGLGWGLLCLTKGIVLGILLASIGFFFLLWDTPRLLNSRYLWLGLLFGIIPVVGWYFLQYQHYGLMFINANLVHESWNRIWEQVGGHREGPGYFLLELVKYPWPWQLFWIPGLVLTWQNRNFSWAKLILIWTGIYLTAISGMTTKLPWYILPLYPVFSLAVGVYLAQIWQNETLPFPANFNPNFVNFFQRFPQKYWIIFMILALLGWGGVTYVSGLISWGQTLPPSGINLSLLLATFAMTMTLSSFLIYRSNRQFIIILFWGIYLSLFLFVNSPHWIWELGEDYPVKPVAMMLKNYTPSQEIFTSHPRTRPSLDFYSDRLVTSISPDQLHSLWLTLPSPYFLLDEETFKNLRLNQVKILDKTGNWYLVTRK